MPAVWLVGLASFCMWSIYIGFGYITPYFTDVFGMGESQVAVISIILANVLFAAGGLISLVAYVPDVYLYTILGNVLDNNPGLVGYRYVFLFMVVCAVVGLIASATLHKINYNNKN